MSIIEKERNAWRVPTADRLSLLVDGAAYFDAVASAIERAERTIYILGWDINSQVRLRRDGGSKEDGDELGGLLHSVLERRPRLHVYVLVWDFAMIYALERDWLPLFNLAWSSHRRLHFRMDDHHPVGACHHQKVVVVDDAVAFAGGIDLTRNRWDTPEHRAEDPRRVDAGGQVYPPFHDVQVAVDGEAARALGDLARERWERATGRRARGPEGSGADPWPPGLEPDLEGVAVGIARTYPAYAEREQTREVERLHLDAIAAAERLVYMENQYFTCSSVAEALAARLRETRGPDVVLVLPRTCSGWLEEKTMGLLRESALKELRDADRGDRLRVYSPVVAGAEPCDVFVHSKLLIVDDRLLLVGSANLSNRSMGLDSECALAVEDRGGPDPAAAIARLRNRLLAEHLAVSPEEVETALAESGSPADAIEALRGNDRTLVPLDPAPSEQSEALLPPASVVDPERAIAPDEILRRLLPPFEATPVGRRGLRIAAVAVALLALAALWRWTPLRDLLSPDNLSSWAAQIADSPFAPAIVTAAFVVGGLMMVPITLMILVTALTFAPPTAFAYALLGALTSAAAGYGLGSRLGRDSIRQLAGSRLNRLSRRLARRGVVTMMATRLVPVAPFTVVNLVAGASHIRFRDFLIGSVLGLAPGVLAVTVLENRLEDALRNPGAGSIALLVGAVAVVVAAGWWLRGRLGGSDGG